jgi:hypothetical protein
VLEQLSTDSLPSALGADGEVLDLELSGFGRRDELEVADDLGARGTRDQDAAQLM